MDKIDPVELDSEFFFITGEAPLNQHARLIKMVVRGMEEDPVCTDVSKSVSQWIPSEIYQMQSSTQEQFVTLAINGKDLYFYRYFKENGEVVMKAWFKWRYDVCEQIVFHTVINGNLYTVLKTEPEADEATTERRVQVCFTQLTTSISNDVLDLSSGRIICRKHFPIPPIKSTSIHWESSQNGGREKRVYELKDFANSITHLLVIPSKKESGVGV